MDNKVLDINEVIIHYLDSTATNPEKVFLLDWLKQSEQNRNDFSEIRDLWLLSNTIPTDDLETEVALDRLKERLLNVVPQKRNSLPLFSIYKWMRIAAVFLLLFSVGFTFYYIGERTNHGQSMVISRLMTADGSKGRFVLPDSTVVWLNSNTLLEYPETFSSTSREVHLTGQAYFEVKRNEKVPFKVFAGEMEVEVLGTHFIVENYPHRSNLEAVLVEGSVKVSGCKMKNHSVVLTPGQLMCFDKSTGRTDVQAVNTSDYISWIQDELTFDNTELANILVNIEKWYGIEIECLPQFAKSIHMSFSIRRGESLDEILKAMTLVAPIKYFWRNDVLNIVSRSQKEN